MVANERHPNKDAHYFGQPFLDQIANDVFGHITMEEAVEAERSGAMAHQCSDFGYCTWAVGTEEMIVIEATNDRRQGDVFHVVSDAYYRMKNQIKQRRDAEEKKG